MVNVMLLKFFAASRRVRGTETRSSWVPYQSSVPAILNLPFRFVLVLSIVCQPSAHLIWSATRRCLAPLVLPLMK